FAPGDNVRGLDGRVPICRQNPHAAQRATVLIGTDDGAAEALVAHGCLFHSRCERRNRLLYLFLSPLQEGFTIVERLDIDNALVQQTLVQPGMEVGLDENTAQRFTSIIATEQLEK